MKCVLTAYDMVTPYGHGLDACWEGLCAGKTALRSVERFDVSAFHSSWGGLVSGLSYHQEKSLVMQMLESLDRQMIPADAHLILASTTGEVDVLEKALLEGREERGESALEKLLEKTMALFGVQSGELISSACISSSAALAAGAAAIRSGKRDAVLIVACDAVTEFVFSGFSSLMALDPSGAHPFDAERKGLSVGEGAAYALLMSDERAKARGWKPVLEIAGWGLSADANHMTGPSRDGSGLAQAMECSLHLAGIDQAQVAFISAHGTGTSYNDAMEMKACARVFDTPRPLFSIKGGMGHSMGVTGLIETVLVMACFDKQLLPPTVGLRRADEDAAQWVSGELQMLAEAMYAISTNAGFGGVNASLVLKNLEGVK